MKKIFFFLTIILLSNSIMAQYVQKRAGEVWGVNENKYSSLGDKALSYIENDMYSLAIDCLKQMLLINCKNANRIKDYYSLAYCYFQTSDHDKTIESCNKYLELYKKKRLDEPTLNDIYFYQGLAYSMNDDYNNAVLCFEKSIAASKTSDLFALMQGHYYAGRCYYVLGNDYISIKNYKKAIIYGCEYYGTSIKEIERYGCKDCSMLGHIFYYYAMPLKDSFNNVMYLWYMSAKCGYEEAKERAPSTPRTPDADIFEL